MGAQYHLCLETSGTSLSLSSPDSSEATLQGGQDGWRGRGWGLRAVDRHARAAGGLVVGVGCVGVWTPQGTLGYTNTGLND